LNQLERSKEMFANTYSNFLQKNWTDTNSRLHQSIRYCLEGGGKRVRALLSMLVSEAYGRDPRVALSAAVAVEMVHAYSLAHDDLPCMDNDDMRRGRPSLHKAFDDCTALLAGDAILTDAFRVLVDEDFFADTSLVRVGDRLKLVQELVVAAGSQGMVYGQDKDIFWTAKNNFNLDDLESIHRSKTGALIGAATAMGAISAGAPTADIRAWREFGVLIGLAFQAIDDALDDADSTGKTANKDKNQNKLTYMRLFTRDEVIGLARRHTDLAITFIPSYVKQDELIGFIGSLIARRS
jgi:geranylgeranyl diphosphate synthase, type II